jgi:hypothetical protein
LTGIILPAQSPRKHPGFSIYSLGGMCAQGTSAGLAAIGYSLTWYGAASHIDKAEMLVGPTLSDVKQGCQVPNNNYTTICSGGGQLGCDGWAAQLPPGYSLKYQDHAGEVETWSGGTAITGPACGNTSNTTTTWDANWLHMSLVDLSGFAGTPSFNYPDTSMAAWLCETDVEGTPNNSGSQGERFYKQITQQSQINGPNSGINAVTSCQGPEGVTFGTPPPDWVAKGLNTAGAAILFDMSNTLSTARCLKRH